MQPPQQQQRSARPGAYLQQQQQPIVEVVPDSAFGPALNWTVYVDADTLGRFVPQSFIGISREYTNESVYWDRNLDAWGAILDVLGPSPIVRIGGASQEALTAPPTPEYLRSLVALHCALGVRFIIGLPLFQNAPALALTIKQAFDKAFANFPKAVLSYELGNEVRALCVCAVCVCCVSVCGSVVCVCVQSVCFVCFVVAMSSQESRPPPSHPPPCSD